MTTEEQFKAAVNVIRNLPKDGPFQPSDDLKLKFYAYFKQATEGPNRTPKPPFYNVVNKYKWDAWKKLGDLDKEKAMQCYVDELKNIIETMSFNESVTGFYEVLGPFYEFLPNKSASQPDLKVNGDVNSDDPIADGNQLSNFRVNGDEDSLKNADSETDEFSDTYDHIADGEIPIGSRNGAAMNDFIEARGGSETNPSRTMSPSSQSVGRGSIPARTASGRDARNPSLAAPAPSSSMGLGSSGAGSGGGGSGLPEVASVGIYEQLAFAVIRLQQSMDQVVNRLDVLESVLVGDRRTANQPPKRRSSWWPLTEISPQTTIVFLLWPFVAHWILMKIQKRQNK